MLAVIDTNVWVSAFLTPHGAPGQLLESVRGGRLRPVYSIAIEDEYREVLFRSKFAINRSLLYEFFARLAEDGARVNPARVSYSNLPDPSDAPFTAAARHAACPIVTRDARHYPPECGAEILSPAACLLRLIG